MDLPKPFTLDSLAHILNRGPRPNRIPCEGNLGATCLELLIGRVPRSGPEAPNLKPPLVRLA